MDITEITIDGRTTIGGNWKLTDLIALGFDKCFPENDDNANRKGTYGYRRYYTIPFHCFGFYDWFCKDYALANKARRMTSMARSIIRADKGKHIDTDKYYISFKNNCPIGGGLYDTLRFFPFDDNSPTYCFSFVDGCVEFNTDEDDEIHTFNSIREAIKWFVESYKTL